MEDHHKDRFLPISIFVAAILIGGAVVFSTLYKTPSGSSGTAYGPGTGAAAQPTAQSNGGAPTTNTAVMQLGSRDAVLGSTSAPVTYIDYGDYQCPFCNRYFTDTFPALKSEYVDTGKVKMIFRDFAFLGPESLKAANAAQCANDQGRLWPYHDALYTAKSKDYANGGSENDGYFTHTLFLGIAQQLGLNMPKFTTCLDGNADAGYVAQEKTDASNAGVNSTPTFYVDGTQLQGAQPLATFQAAIDQAVALKQ